MSLHKEKQHKMREGLSRGAEPTWRCSRSSCSGSLRPSSTNTAQISVSSGPDSFRTQCISDGGRPNMLR